MDLGDLKQRILEAHARRPMLINAAAAAQRRLRRARWQQRITRWPVLRVLLDAAAAARAVMAAEEAAADARAARDRCVVNVDFPLNEEARAANDTLLHGFENLRGVDAIWNVAEATEIDRARHRSSAIAALVRHRVVFDHEGTEVIASRTGSLHLPNVGGDLRFYAGFLMLGGAEEFRLIDLADCRVEYADSDFIEQETVPPDAERLGDSWLKSNKDGSPDLRFRDNRELPLVRYGHLEVVSNDSVLAVYQVSDWKMARAFAYAMADYQWALAGNARA